MRKDLNAGGSLRAVMQQYHLALEQAICQLAQAVGNHPPERRRSPFFFRNSLTVAGTPMRRPRPTKVRN